jgi:hypothetical protein
MADNFENDPEVQLFLETGRRKSALIRQNYSSAATVNPAQAAEDQTLSRMMSVPTDAVREYRDDIKQQAAASSIDADKIVKEAPVLANRLQDPTSAAISQNDIKNLHKTETGFTRFVDDSSTMFVKGMLGIPQAVVGLVDIPTGGRPGKWLEEHGLDLQKLQNFLGTQYSTKTQEAQQKYQESKGIGEKAATVVKNPSIAVTTIGESLPAMFAGGGVAKALITKFPALSAVIGGAIGEGALTAGQTEESIRYQTPDKTTTLGQGAAALTAGIFTGGLSVYGGKFAEAFGLADIDTMIARGGTEAAVASGMKQGFIKSVVGSGISEGLLEEFPQSVQEQMWQNWALDKPLMTDVDDAMLMGTVSGGVMGSAAGTLSYIGSRLESQSKGARRQAEFIQNITNAASESETKKLDPKGYEDHVQNITQDTNVETMYVESDQFVNVLNQMGVTREELGQMLPEVVSQLDNSTPGSDITFNTSAYMARIAGTDLGNALAPHIRIDSDLPSTAESVQVDAIKNKLLTEAATNLEEKRATDKAFYDSANAVETRFYDQLMSTGKYTSEEAKGQANLVKLFVAQNASKFKQMPEEFYNRYEYKIMTGSLQNRGGQFNQQEFVKRNVAQRNEQLKAAAVKLQNGEITREEYETLVNKVKPVLPYESIPTPATHEEMKGALKGTQVDKVGKIVNYENGTPVSSRLDINAYTNHNVWAPTIHDENNRTIAHESTVHLTGPITFGTSDTKGIKIAQGGPKTPYAVIHGNLLKTPTEDAFNLAQQYLNDPDWIQVGFDPERHSYFYNRKSLEPVIGGDEMLQIGPLVLVKNPKYGEKSNYLYQSLSTRIPTIKSIAPEYAIENILTIDFATTLSDLKTLEKNVNALRNLPNFPPSANTGNPTTDVNLFIDHVVENLLFLHDQMQPAQRKRAKQWYDGGRRMAEAWAERYGISEMQAAAAIAVLSPQNDWFQNVSSAERVADIIFGMRDFMWDADMDKTAETILSVGERNLQKLQSQKPKNEAEKEILAKKIEDQINKNSADRAVMDQVRNKRLGDIINLDPEVVARWVRVFDETHNIRDYNILTPEGGAAGVALTDAGVPAKNAWKTFGVMAKAISVLLDGRAENVFYQIGSEHKVRNFYNNIYDPKSKLGFATIDTHAVAAALMQPFAGGDEPVTRAFGGAGAASSGVTGLRGTYPIYLEAYRRAAAKRKILPREMQSITWEAVRGLFEGPQKQALKPQVKAIWEQWQSGAIATQADALSQIFALAGGITDPSWSKVKTNKNVGRTYKGLAQATIDQQKPKGKVADKAANIIFEVAPNPDDVVRSAKWDALSEEDKLNISLAEAREVIPKILKEFSTTGDFVMQIGGYEGKTNPSMTLQIDKQELAIPIAKALGFVLRQKGMVALMKDKVANSFENGLVSLKLPEGYGLQEISALYDKLWPLENNGKKLVVGFTVTDGVMNILHDPEETGVATVDLADLIAQTINDTSIEVIDGVAYSAFPSQEDYNYEQKVNQAGRPVAGVASPESRILNKFREQSTERVDREVQKATERAAAESIPESGPGTGILEQAPLFYSVLKETVSNSKVAKQSAQDWLNMLKGKVKQEEIEASDLVEFLGDRKGITKEEIVNYLDSNGVQILETLTTDDIELAVNNILEPYGIEAALEHGEWAFTDKTNDEFVDFMDLQLTPEDHQAIQSLKSSVFKNWSFGLPEYKELIMHLPVNKPQIIESDRFPGSYELVYDNGANVLDPITDTTMVYSTIEQAMQSDQYRNFGTSKELAYSHDHWVDMYNVLCHVRLETKANEDGSKTLVVTEVQSDWGQEGRDVGFRAPVDFAAEYALLRSRRYQLVKQYDEAVNDPVLAQDGEYLTKIHNQIVQVKHQINELDKKWLLRNPKANSAKAPVPHGPFVTDTQSWSALAVKRIMRYAADHGFQKIAFINGKQAAERFNLRQSVEYISYNSETHVVRAWNSGRFEVLYQKDVSKDDIPGIFGKEVAARLLATEPVLGKQYNLDGEQLEVGGEGMLGYYNNILPIVVKKLVGKFGTKPYLADIGLPLHPQKYNNHVSTETKMRHLNAGPQQQMIVDLTPEMMDELKKPQPLFQKTGGPRGGFDPATFTTLLTQEADSSTFFHETGHFFLAAYADMASDVNSPEEIKKDFQTVLDWFGIPNVETWNSMSLDDQRPYHEQFAYNYEIYISEGKAPSVGMQKLFDDFSRWIRRAYLSIKNELNEVYKKQFGKDLPILTGEVRQVMDRMIASEESISQAEVVRNMMPMFMTQEESGMDDDRWNEYQKLIADARETSIANLTKSSISQLKWVQNARSRYLKKLQAQVKETRKQVAAEVEKQIKDKPIYKAIRWIKNGEMTDPETGEEIKVLKGHKLNSDAIKEMYPETMLARPDLSKLRGMTSDEGLHPDVVAEMLGYSSGDQLIQELISTPTLKEAVQQGTDIRMASEYGNLLDHKQIEADVERALHNEARARFVAAELRFLNKATQPVRVMLQAAKLAAQQLLSNVRLSDINTRKFSVAESKAAAMVFTHLKKGESEKAIAAKQSQLLQHQLATESIDILDEVKKNVTYLRRVTNDNNRKKIGADAADQIDSILERFDLHDATKKDLKRQLDLKAWLEAQQNSGLELEIPEDIQNAALRTNYMNLTVNQFKDLVDSIKQIEAVGRNAQTLITNAKLIAYKQARDEMVQSIKDNAGNRKHTARTATTKMGEFIQDVRGFFSEHIKAAIIARIFDGGKDGGPVWEYLIRPANERANLETDMRAKATEDLTEILAPVLSLGNMGGKGIYFDSVGRHFNRESLLTIALNWGNESNRQRLLGGENWSPEQVIPLLQSLTKAEWFAVQQIWKYFETYRPLIAAKERRVYGKEPTWIDPAPFSIMTADGESINLDGGYYPVVFDPKASQAAGQFEAAEEAKRQMQSAFTSATTRRSFTKQRVKEVKGRPLMYSLTGLYRGINEVIHDLSWHEFLIDANKILRSGSLYDAIATTYGPEAHKQLREWVKDVAIGERPGMEFGDKAIGFVRQGVSAAGLGFNVLSAILNATGYASSIVRLGPKWAGKGISKTLGDLRGAVKMVNEKSSFMAARSKTQFRELNELRNKVRGESKTKKTIQLGTYFLMMQVQRVVDIPTWIGAYEKAVSEGNISVNEDGAIDESRAIALADQAVTDSQGSGLLKDLAKVERGGAWQKLFTVFYSYMNTQLNLAVSVGMTTKGKAKLTAQYLMLFMAPVILNYALKAALVPGGGGAGDDDEWDWGQIAKNLTSETLSYMMGMFIVLRELSFAFKTVLGAEGGNRDYQGPAGVRPFADVGAFAVQAHQGEFDSAFIRTGINVLGDFTGLPSAQINRTISGVEALAEGKTENPAALLTGYR